MFKGHCFPKAIILQAVYFKLRFSLSYRDYKAGDIVKKNDVVGHTTDEFGHILEEYKSTKDGIILYMLSTPPINKKDTVMCISSYEE